MSLRRAVFLDRDGVLTVSEVRDGRPYAPTALEKFAIYPDATDSVARLKAAGFLAIVVTNQPDVVRGKMSQSLLATFHDRLTTDVGVDDIRTCLCLEDDPDCACYKPRPGMLTKAAADYGIDLAASYMVGDRWRDVGAGQNAGCKTVFIERGYSEVLRHQPNWTVNSLGQAVEVILADQE